MASRRDKQRFHTDFVAARFERVGSRLLKVQGSAVATPMRARRRRAAALLAPLIAALTLAGAALAASAPDRHANHKGERQERPDPVITVRAGKGGQRLVHPGLFGVNHRYAFDGFGMCDPSIPGVP